MADRSIQDARHPVKSSGRTRPFRLVGACAAEPILASRLGAATNRPDIWKQTIRCTKIQTFLQNGAVHIWTSDGEKYALIGLTTRIEQPIPFRELVSGLWAWTDRTLELPAHWREGIGSIRSKEIESCNLVFLSKWASRSPDVLKQLQDRVCGFYNGTAFVAGLARPAKPKAAARLERRGPRDREPACCGLHCERR